MPIKVPNDLPAIDTLTEENVFVMTDTRAITQDMRPLHILLLNLMPTKIETETQLTRLLGNTPLQIELELLQTAASSELAAYKKAEEQKGLFTREKLKKEAKRVSREDELSRELRKAKAFISACGLSSDFQQFRYNCNTRNNTLE